MRLFYLERSEDESGVSGTGRVAEGVQFTSGQVTLCWLTDTPSIGIYKDITHVEMIHGHGGKTIVKWLDNTMSFPGIH